MTTENIEKEAERLGEGRNEAGTESGVAPRPCCWRLHGSFPVSDTGYSAAAFEQWFSSPVIVCAFVTGVLLNGELGTPKPENPFSWLAAFACLGNGVLVSGARRVDQRTRSDLPWLPLRSARRRESLGCGFCLRQYLSLYGRLMNLLAVLDVSDIARGREGLRWTTFF